MDQIRWQKVEELYHAALQIPHEGRAAFIDQACDGDGELRREVESLLAQDSSKTGPLERPAWEGAAGSLENPQAKISPGARLGPYEILGPIGTGGMGEVHKARDTRLNRIVAIKLLTDAVNNGGGNRLLREAQAASALNHPNIVTVHDVLSRDGCDVIVMEYVEGTTLADRIGRKGMPLHDSLRYLAQIAGALSAAHGAGIVHRDIKPRNIMVTEAGVAKVLDFGLAHVEPTAGPNGETATLTAPGTIAGTFLYMSPEQAEGKRVDARSDIFAFGSLAYEMLSGRQAFPGDSRMAILSGILHREPPPLSSVRPDVPLELEKLVHRCLRKDPGRRMQSMEDVRILLLELLDTPVTPSAASAPSRARRPLRKAAIPALIAALALLAGALLALVWLPPSETDLSSYRLTPFATEAGEEKAPAWSPDGRTLAYEFVVDGVRQIYTRGLDAPSGTRVTSSAADCQRPFWSPDGRSIYYLSQRKLWSVSPAGGAPRTVTEASTAAISPDGNTLVLTRGVIGAAELFIASPVGAQPQPYRAAPFSGKLAQISFPQFAPDGSKFVVFISRHAAISEPEFWIVPFTSGAPKQVPLRLPGNQSRPQSPSWMPDSRRLILSLQDRLYSADTQSGELRQITASTVVETEPAVSPDGRRIAFASGTSDSNIIQIALDGSSSKPLLATSRRESDPVWSPVNSEFAYVTTASGVPEIWVRDANGNGARPLVRPETASEWYDVEKLNFSPDGSRISFDKYGERHVVAISSVAGGRPVMPEPESRDHHGISWSPDGNWIAYRRLNGAKWELVKRPLGGGDPVWLEEAAEGGSKTDWSSSGEWICHQVGFSLHLVSPDGSRHVAVETGGVAAFGFSRDGATLYAIRRNSARKWELAGFAVPSGQQKKVVPLDLPAAATVSGFSPSPDGRSFITSVGESLLDIWFLEGFAPPRHWFFR